MNHFGVIMAGGGGTRFWPLSRKRIPKQLLNLSGKGLMINEAVDRMATVIGKSNMFIVTSELQASAMLRATEGKVFPRNILAEPAARNTAACIGYAAVDIVKRFGDGVMVITPADHYIKDVAELTDIFRLALTTAEDQDKLVTIGLKPAFPATGYGYIQYDASVAGRVRPVISFREKPDEETARSFIQSGDYAWNSGMFIWKASLILRKMKELVPDIYDDLMKIGEAINTPEEQDVLHEVYPKIRKISIDYAVMEPCAGRGDALMIMGECGWNDVGSWDMMDIFHEADDRNNIFVGDVVGVDVTDSVIYSSHRTVTAVDVDHLVIVETPDAVMVCPKDKAQSVKKIVDALSVSGREELL